MICQHDFIYAFEKTRMFFNTRFSPDLLNQTNIRFCLITEPMDQIGSVCLRIGKFNIKPFLAEYNQTRELALKKSDTIDKFLEFLPEYEHNFRKFFELAKEIDISQVYLQKSKEEVFNTISKKALLEETDATITFIEGIEEAWQVSLFRFAFELVNIIYEVFD